jgi:signal transduction histidine kinase
MTDLRRKEMEILAREPLSAEGRLALDRLAEEADLPYILEEVPDALNRTIQGVERVATIVRAMKEFAHPDQKQMVAADLNGAVKATVEVARNEYKYVADLELCLGEIPPVLCYPGDLNQVFLNLIVNAAHAIGDVVKGTTNKGKIKVSTSLEGSQVVVKITDTGTGIPEEIASRVFDPFFTTKGVGKGTGQGLAIARSILKKHKGTISFESKASKGTTFFVRLPADLPNERATTTERVG